MLSTETIDEAFANCVNGFEVPQSIAKIAVREMWMARHKLPLGVNVELTAEQALEYIASSDNAGLIANPLWVKEFALAHLHNVRKKA